MTSLYNNNKIISYIVFSYVISLLLFSYNSTLYVINRLLFIILVIAFLFIFLRRDMFISKNSLVFLPFLFLVIMSNIWAVSFQVSIHRTIGLLSYFTPAFIIYAFVYNEIVNIKYLFNSYFVSVVILGLSALYDFFVIGSTRAAGFVENANSYGLITIYFTLLIWPVFKRSVFLKTILLLFVSMAVYFSGSRKVLLAAGIVLLLNLIFRSKIKIKKIKLKHIFLLLTVSIFIIYMGYLFINGDISFKSFELDSLSRLITLEDSSFNTRESMITIGVHLFQSKPILGYGIDNFRFISPFGTYSHNNYIELLISIGVIGLLFYYRIYYKIIKLSYQKRKKNNQSAWFKLTIIVILLIINMEFAYVSINSTEIWLVLFSLLVLNERPLNYTETNSLQR